MTEVVIVSAARTPVGSFLGALSSLPASKLGEIAIKAALERAGVAGDEVDEVILGHVLQAAAGQGPARQAAVGAGVRQSAPAWSLNQICGSGLRAVAVAAQQIALGDAGIVVAGGQESMSQAPHAQQLRTGHKMGDVALIDTMIKDGLWDAFNGYHMGQTAENVANQWQISRDMQDEFALQSQLKAEAAAQTRESAKGLAGAYGTKITGLYSISDVAPNFAYGVQAGTWGTPGRDGFGSGGESTTLDKVAVTGSRYRASSGGELLTAAPITGTNQGADHIPRAPRSLIETTRIFQRSDIARDWLGDTFVDHFSATREWEHRQWQDAVTDWELKRYFEII